ncbi:MAG: LacI family transcriptional regulator [Oscillospiraceae bacterium]|nr:LacI family transcriptional regulator [Oscillospiraceae bacterium]
MAVTIRDVSMHCGLSVSTVSKALNNYPDISGETRRRVLHVAQEIGYFPNALARGLKTNRTYNLGVILDDELKDSLLHTYFITILNGFKREAEMAGYDITLINHNIGGQTLSYLDHCRYRNVDGICLMCLDFFAPEIVGLIGSDLALVTIDHQFPDRDCIHSDNRAGVNELVDYIVEMGHRRIAFVHGTPSVVTDVRLAAFHEAIQRHGLTVPEEYIVSGHYHSTAHGREVTQQLLSLKERPSLIMMSDDYSALGAIELIHEMGLRIPEDISITGYDGTAMIQKIRPKLTTLFQDGEEIGRRAAIRLLERIEQPPAPVRPADMVPGKLLCGQTVLDLNGSKSADWLRAHGGAASF